VPDGSIGDDGGGAPIDSGIPERGGETSAPCEADCGSTTVPDAGACTSTVPAPASNGCATLDGGPFPSLSNCCSTDADCTIGVYQTTCCGRSAVGINGSAGAEFARIGWYGLNDWSCGCFCDQSGVVTQDGVDVGLTTHDLIATCDQGVCKSHVNPDGGGCQPVGVGCFSSADCCNSAQPGPSQTHCESHGGPLGECCYEDGGCPL